MDHKHCTKCKAEKLLADFYQPHSSWCKECMRAEMRSHIKKPEIRENLREYQRYYYHDEKNKRKLQERAVRHRLKRMANDLKGYKMCEMLTNARRRAKANNSEFSITEADLGDWRNLTHCPVLGIELKWDNPNTSEKRSSPTIDRIDSLYGYVPGNVIMISYRANTVKNSGTANEHRKIADFMDRYQSR